MFIDIVWVCSKKTTFEFGLFRPFLAIFFQLHVHLSQNLSADSHFEVLKTSKAQLDLKLSDKIQVFLFPIYFNFGRKNTENLWQLNGHFLTIYGHFYGNYIDIIHKPEIQTVILRCLVCLNLNWIKSYGIIIG